MPLQTHSTKQWKKAIVVQILLFSYTLSLYNDYTRTLFYLKSNKMVLICKEITSSSYDNEWKPLLKIPMKFSKQTWNVCYSTRRPRSSLIWMLSGTFVLIKRENIFVTHPAQTSGWNWTICLSAPELRSGIEKNKVLLLFFVISTSICCSGTLEIPLGI